MNANEKETALNEALRAYQIERPKMKFLAFCVITRREENFTKEEKKEAKEISKTLRV